MYISKDARLIKPKTFKAKKNWVVIDRILFLSLVEEKRRKRLLPPDDDGACLWKLESEVIVARAFEAYTERQARMYAANGGTWQEVEKRKRLGQPLSRKYQNAKRYIVAEMVVLDHLRRSKRLEWDMRKVREEICRQQGELSLTALCSAFKPGESAEMAARRLAQSSKKFYRIIDLVEFARFRALALLAAGAHHTGATALVHEGRLLARATSTARIRASSWLEALHRFHDRVQGEMRVLPFGRYTAIVESEWLMLIELRQLPAKCTREALREALRKSYATRNFPWYAQREPGSDGAENGPFMLPGVYDPLEFPPREARYEPLIDYKPRRRRRRPQVKPMVQLEIIWPPPPLYDRKKPEQVVLFLV